MNPTSPIDRARLSAHRMSVGQRLLSSWFWRPALWSLIVLCTATALVLVVNAAKPENDPIERSKTASRLADAAGRDGNVEMNTVLVNTISGTVFDANGIPITGGRTIKLIQNGGLSGTTATSDNVTGIYTFTGLTLASGDKIAVYISGATEKGATVTVTDTLDNNTLDIYQNRLIVRSEVAAAVTNANLKLAQGGSPPADLTGINTIDGSNVVTIPSGISLQIWTGTTFAPGADINDGGDWINNGTLTPGTHTVTFNGTSNQTIKGNNSTTFNNLAIANGGDPNIPSNIVALDGSLGATNTTAATLTISNGVFDQGLGSASSNLSLTGTGDVATITSNGIWQNFGTGDITLNGDITNNGLIEIDANAQPCGQSDDIFIRSSVGGTQRTWKGTGTFSMTDVDVQDQKVPGGVTLPLKILVSSGTDHPGTNIGWEFRASCGGPYTWQGGANNRWVTPSSWSPTRSDAGDLVTDDELIFDGSVTPTAVIDEVPNQTNNAIHLTNGVIVNLSEPQNLSATLELHGATGQDLDVAAGTVLILSGSLPFTIQLTAPGHQGQVTGQIVMRDDKHQLIGDNPGEITITGEVTIASNYSAITHPFGEGTNGSVVFESGSTGTFNSGLDPFGGANRTVATFNSGSTAHFLTTVAFFGNGGSYGNLILDGDAQNYFQAGANPITILNNLEIVTGNTFVLSSSPGADMNLYGNFVDNTVISSGFTPNSRVMKFLGATQTVFKAAGIVEFSNILINQLPGGKVQLLSPLDITGQLNLNNADSLLELNGQSIEIIGTVTGPGNLKGDPNANVFATGVGPVGTINFVSDGRTLLGLGFNRSPNGSMTLGTSLDIAGTLRLDNGILNTGVNTLSLSSTSSVLLTNGYVNGNLQKSFGASGNLGSFTFPLGTANAYSPLDANVTANTNGTLTAKAVEGQQPNIPGGTNALQRYWTLSGSGITADLTFHYSTSPTNDVVGNEAIYKIFKYDGSFTPFTPDATGSNSASDHFATVNNISSFSDWTLVEPAVVNQGTVAFVGAPYTTAEGNGDHDVTITVARTGGSDGTLDVTYATSASTATAGTDYIETTSTLHWNGGESGNKTFLITVKGDATHEADETVTITLSNPTSGVTIEGQNPTTLTITNDDPVPTISIGDVTHDEGNAGVTNYTFTVALSNPSQGTITVDYQTQNNSAVAPGDYTAVSTPQTLTFVPGDISKQFTIPANGDTEAEPIEKFFVNLSNNSSNSTLPPNTKGTGTISNDDEWVGSGQFIISEFRLRGPAGQYDEFVEIYNTTDSDIVVADANPISCDAQSLLTPPLIKCGWALVDLQGAVSSTPRFVIPAGTTIPARGHYLAAGSAYSLTAAAAPDQTYDPPLYDGGEADYTGLTLFRTADRTQFTPANLLDSVGFDGLASPFREVTGLLPASGVTADAEHSFLRNQASGFPADTNNNRGDFVLVATNPATISGASAVLGVPGPESLTSPIQRNNQFLVTIPPGVSSTLRQTSPAVTNGALGTLSLRRRFILQTGSAVTKLRFRVTNQTTVNSPIVYVSQADVRVLNATLSGLSGTGLKAVTIDPAPSQPQGGGINTSLLVSGSLTLSQPLQPGQSLDVEFLLGVMSGGSYKFIITVEASP